MNPRVILGNFVFVIFVLVALYVGIYVMLIGGILDIIREFKAEEIYDWGLTIGIIKILFCSVIGYIIGVIGYVLSLFIKDEI